jgi:acyl-CoA reductase-like NAD-dependent aldehyde dehydrogenase
MGVLDTRHRAASGTPELDVRDPATGATVGRIPAGSTEAAHAAACQARSAQDAWACTAPAARAAALKAGAERLREHARELAQLQTREGGRPLADSIGRVEAGVGAIERYAELGPLHHGRSVQGDWGTTELVVREPCGVVALLVSWDDPVAIACAQLAAALVTGNAVVLKPSEKTPLSGARIAELLDLPALVLLQGDERAARPLAAHEHVDRVVSSAPRSSGSTPTSRSPNPSSPPSWITPSASGSDPEPTLRPTWGR